MRSFLILLVAVQLTACGAPGGGEGKGNGSVRTSDLPLKTETNVAGTAETNLAGTSTARPTGSPGGNTH